MIIGLGHDIVNIDRIDRSIAKFGNNFINRIFTDLEIEYSKKITSKKRLLGFFAKRFAAKEAFVKALGTGIRNGITFRDISVVNNDMLKPELLIKGAALKQLNIVVASYKNYQISLSLTDEYPIASAIVIISGE